MYPVADLVPGAASILGTGSEKKEEEEPKQPETTPGPPLRPHHDDKIEEFVRDQHRSKKADNGQIAG